MVIAIAIQGRVQPLEIALTEPLVLFERVCGEDSFRRLLRLADIAI